MIKEVDAGVLPHPSSATVQYSAADATTSLEEQHALAGGLSGSIQQHKDNTTTKAPTNNGLLDTATVAQCCCIFLT